MPRPRLLLFSVAFLAVFAAACADKASAPGDETGTPADTETLTIFTTNDVALNGRLFGSNNKVAVVLAHMRASDQRAWFDFAQDLADNGYAAVTFDFRGYGESPGQQDFSTLDDDLRSVIGYLHDRGYQQVFLVGASMGGTASLVVAPDGGIAGIVSVSSIDEFEGQKALDAVPNITVPKLFIASELDEPAKLSLDEFMKAASEPKDSQVYDGNAHGTNMFLLDSGVNTAVRERILGFLREHAEES